MNTLSAYVSDMEKTGCKGSTSVQCTQTDISMNVADATTQSSKPVQVKNDTTQTLRLEEKGTVSDLLGD